MSLPLLAFGMVAFVLGGFVKGTLGVGLPMIVVPLLSLTMPGHQAIGLVAIPVLASNAWQARETRVPVAELRRFVPLIIALVAATLLTVRLTLGVSEKVLGRMIAAAVLTGVLLTARQPHLAIGPRGERRWGMGVGLVSGAPQDVVSART